MKTQSSQRAPSETACLLALALRTWHPLRFFHYINISVVGLSAPGAPRPAPRALTLIELLVVIVILVTLVAGVIPILSPNNDVRKIREAARGLHTYLVAAQAEAARTGRPQGIGFRETPNGGGVALEAFRLEVPVPFAGFSENSRVTVTPILPSNQTYGSGGTGNGGTKFINTYNGVPLFELRFLLAAGGNDPFPPRMFRIGDQVDIDSNTFMIVDDSQPMNQPNAVATFAPNNNVQYLVPDLSNTPTPTICIWLNSAGQQLPPPTALKPYKIIRQAANSTASPYVFPDGIGIDMQGSVHEGGQETGYPIPNSFATINMTSTSNPQPIPDSAGILFSPSGHVSSVIHNGTEITNVSRIMLLLGRIENGDVGYQTPGGPVNSGDWQIATNASNDQLEQKQSVINWLNLESRWIAIATQSGRITVNENAFVDARLFGDLTALEQAEEQIEAAHDLAHSMKQLGGR